MSRKMPAGWIDLSRRRDKQVESHSTLRITIDTPQVVRTYYFATAELNFQNVNWQPLMKRGDQIGSSLTRAADQATAEIFNADGLIGKEFLSLGLSIYSAEVQIGRWKRDFISNMEAHKVFLTGPLVSFQVEDTVKLNMVSEAFANTNVGSSRAVSPICQWVFRDVSTCQYAGTLMTCNLLLEHTDGCKGRHGDPLYRAKNGSMAFLNNQNRLRVP